MGDKGSEIRIFLADTGEEVAMAKDAQIHLSPTEEPEQEPSVWSPHSYEITGTMTIDQLTQGASQDVPCRHSRTSHRICRSLQC